MISSGFTRSLHWGVEPENLIRKQQPLPIYGIIIIIPIPCIKEIIGLGGYIMRKDSY